MTNAANASSYPAVKVSPCVHTGKEGELLVQVNNLQPAPCTLFPAATCRLPTVTVINEDHICMASSSLIRPVDTEHL